MMLAELVMPIYRMTAMLTLTALLVTTMCGG